MCIRDSFPAHARLTVTRAADMAPFWAHDFSTTPPVIAPPPTTDIPLKEWRKAIHPEQRELLREEQWAIDHAVRTADVQTLWDTAFHVMDQSIATTSGIPLDQNAGRGQLRYKTVVHGVTLTATQQELTAQCRTIEPGSISKHLRTCLTPHYAYIDVRNG